VWLIQWMKSRSEKNEFGVPIPNFARVTDTIYRGALPDTEGYRALALRLRVERVCSLIEHEVGEDREHALAAGIKEWRHIAFSDKDAPPPARVREWLDHMRSAEKDGAIFTHCRGGRHRTGVLVGVYRVTDCGWTKEQAINEMQRYGWYSAIGHRPLMDWFLNAFDPKDYGRNDEV
jgi:protein-tyrosine phosphatase